MTLQTAINGFLVEQKIRGNSKNTVQYYEVSLRLYARFIGSDLDLQEITLDGLRSYYLYLSGQKLASITVQTYIRALRSFLSWCYEEEYTEDNFSEKFRLPKAQKKIIDILSDEEIHLLFSCFNVRSFVQLRNYCMCCLMLDSGLRLHEVVTLTMDHVHLSEGFLIVNGKGNKERLVPLGLNTRKVLLKYIVRRPGCTKTDRVFIMTTLEPVTDCTLRQMFRKLKKKTGISRLHAHLLRHTFATRYLENGGDMYSLQQILGHTSLEMVKKYIHFTTGKMIPNYSLYSPMDNLVGA